MITITFSVEDSIRRESKQRNAVHTPRNPHTIYENRLPN